MEKRNSMQTYKNLGSNSGIRAFELGDGVIIVHFKDGWHYQYTNQSAGADNIAEMHRCALAGRGLNSFINRTAKFRYDKKWRG